MQDATTLLTVVTALGCGLVAGVFFAFSTFVMAALGRLPAAQAIAAMQSINVAVINVAFMGVLFGTLGLCVARAVVAAMQWQRPGSDWAITACAAYLVGTIMLTIVFHVPRNDALATLDPAAPASADAWAKYLTQWTLGNHVRMLAALAATAMLIVALLARPAAES